MVPEVLERVSALRGERKEKGNNGEEQTWEVSAFPVIVKPGKVFQVIHQLKDISEKKWLEAQMIQAEKLASLGQLAAGVAHEINNPLASLSIFTELLRRREMIDEETQRYLMAMEENVDRMAKIVRGLLDFSRPSPRHFCSLKPSRGDEEFAGDTGKAFPVSRCRSRLRICRGSPLGPRG